MIFIECVQGQAEWHWHRLGIPTASNFDRILTPEKRQYSKSKTYLYELLSEWLTGIPNGVDASGFMERGQDLEAQAVAYHQMMTGEESTPGGVVLRDDRLVACSPDRLVGKKRGLEIKSPGAKAHVANLLEGTSDYNMQIQGNLWLTERESWDLECFHPVLPTTIVTVHRDEELISQLQSAVDRFLGELQQARDRLLALGAKPATALDREFASKLALRPDSGDPF